jgi:hypothetical protein
MTESREAGSPPYSGKPMTRMQFLMLRFMEAGAHQVEAHRAADPKSDMFENRPYTEWLDQD